MTVFSVIAKFAVAQAEVEALRASLADIAEVGDIEYVADLRRFEVRGNQGPRRLAALIALSIEAYGLKREVTFFGRP